MMRDRRLTCLPFDMANTKKTIGIDARFYGPLGKGLGRYIQEIVDRLADNDKINDYVIFLGKGNYEEFQPVAANIRKCRCDVPWYSLREQLEMPWYIWREGVDLMHFPHFNVPWLTPCPFVVTIHDLILTHFPTPRASTLTPFLYACKDLAYRLTIRIALRRSREVIAVSKFTKDDIVRQFKVDPAKISVTYEGVADMGQQASLFCPPDSEQETLRRYFLPDKFFLYVGNAYPHKNLERLVSAFASFHAKHKDIGLVIVGKHDYFYRRLLEQAKRLNLWQEGNHYTPISFPGYVPDQDLQTLYRQALAYVFPSLYEGFGLPPLEAMSFSCPVLSSDKGSLPEILGEAAMYMDPVSQADMEAKMERIIFDDKLRMSLVAKGLERIKKYSWDECTRQTSAIYQRNIADKK